MGKTTKPTQPRYDVFGRYTALLDAGETLLCQSYEQAQPQLIADNAGVSVGLFYRHFKSKQELLTAIIVRHLNKLHLQISQAHKPCSDPKEAMQMVVLLTLRYFHQHQGLIKLFFMQVGYGDMKATEQLQSARQNYRNILLTIIEDGIAQRIFLNPPALNVQIAINSIIGTINWTLYDLLVVQNQNLEPEVLATQISSHLLRSLTR
ncbi:TetR/AcrR family transcriptional regulator [Nostoc sp. LEGE 12450]|uniref:TetR/AcrR family transcriptional regulator n=1 Tax=Nostoc sp. LEGE 12450 TaxID=1828643 RepID=UPI001880917A|nr:TetR/AcrR family transcriptional regulator [Nostoc sp. LEGE 12450]MBE8991924.1 TetR/AcrR family transcriptional regulator [Nostoc sp. LEGE 12450]